MTAEELRNKLNIEYGMSEQWPKTLEVDAETYGNCCHAIFMYADNPIMTYTFGHTYEFALGHNKGLMFKGVELILKKGK